jgi:hypothetical protein
MHYCRRLFEVRFALLGIVLLICALSNVRALAQSTNIKSAEIRREEAALYLDADYAIALPPPLEDALNHGLTLNFILEFELVYSRWYTLFLWDKTAASAQQPYRLVHHLLTRDYRLTAGALEQSFATLDEALSQMGRVRNLFVLRSDDVDSDRVYEARVRLRLDTSLLPKPLQINALASREWNITADWYRWTITPGKIK